MKRLLMALGACACALGLFADVIYVAADGEGSGSSWDDPAGLTAGFEQAVAADGGEIWIKAGTYRMSGATGLTACSNLVVRGGFAGDETSAFAKCARPIYESEGVLYFYAPGMVSGSPWRKCTSRGTNLAELDAGDPLPDAFGAERTEGQICYGPALTDPLGLLLMLK